MPDETFRPFCDRSMKVFFDAAESLSAASGSTIVSISKDSPSGKGHSRFLSSLLAQPAFDLQQEAKEIPVWIGVMSSRFVCGKRRGSRTFHRFEAGLPHGANHRLKVKSPHSGSAPEDLVRFSPKSRLPHFRRR